MGKWASRTCGANEVLSLIARPVGSFVHIYFFSPDFYPESGQYALNDWRGTNGPGCACGISVLRPCPTTFDGDSGDCDGRPFNELTRRPFGALARRRVTRLMPSKGAHLEKWTFYCWRDALEVRWVIIGNENAANEKGTPCE